MNYDDPALCQFDNNDPESLGWSAGTGYVPYTWKGFQFPQGVYQGTAPLWDDLLNNLVPHIIGGIHGGGFAVAGTWGAENRDNVNDAGQKSFHACGRALDINAPWNGNGSGWHDGETWGIGKWAAGICRARGFLSGGEWGDAMHTELHLTPAGIRARLIELGHTTPPAHPTSLPFPLPAGHYFGPLNGPNESISGLYKTDTDADRADIRIIQGIVHVTQDGFYGPKTQAAVKSWQAVHGLANDGLTGPLTWAAMTRGMAA